MYYMLLSFLILCLLVKDNNLFKRNWGGCIILSTISIGHSICIMLCPSLYQFYMYFYKVYKFLGTDFSLSTTKLLSKQDTSNHWSLQLWINIQINLGINPDLSGFLSIFLYFCVLLPYYTGFQE